MAQLIVRNLEDHVKERLQERAARSGRSMEEEVRKILRDAVDDEEEIPLGTWIAKRFAGIGFEEGEIQELRGEVRPAKFDE